MLCPRCDAPFASIAVGVATIERCTHCRGVWATRAALESLVGAAVVGRPAGVSIAGVGGAAFRCPSCSCDLEPEETREAPGEELLVCRDCARMFVDDATLTLLRAARARAESRRPREVERAARLSVEPSEGDDRPADEPEASEEHTGGIEGSVFAPGPLHELAVLAGLALVLWLVTNTLFGTAFAFLARIQFHELGHALVAWCTGRSALPLPFGWTSWSFERSTPLVAMELLFSVLLAIWGAREKKPLAVGVAVAMGATFALGLVTPLTTSESWLVAGGVIGEALLPAITLLAFHAPLPRRARWDFFRWPLAMFALFALVSVAPHFLAIASGSAPLPMGSFVSGREGDGDLERLIADYAWPESTLRPLFGRLGLFALVLGLAPHPIVLGARAWIARAKSPHHARRGSR